MGEKEDMGEALGLHLALQWVGDMRLDNIDFDVDTLAGDKQMWLFILLQER